MADTVTKQWIYPPNWDIVYGESFPGEVMAVRNDGFQHRGFRAYELKLTNTSDGTGESAVRKVDISNMRDAVGRIAVRTVIEKITFATYGMSVTLYWETTPSNRVIVTLPESTNATLYGPFVDPRIGDGSDGSGDILLTTTNHSSGDMYDITLVIKPKGQHRIVPPSNKRGW